jgi:hypothetical protein
VGFPSGNHVRAAIMQCMSVNRTRSRWCRPGAVPCRGQDQLVTAADLASPADHQALQAAVPVDPRPYADAIRRQLGWPLPRATPPDPAPGVVMPSGVVLPFRPRAGRAG